MEGSEGLPTFLFIIVGAMASIWFGGNVLQPSKKSGSGDVIDSPEFDFLTWVALGIATIFVSTIIVNTWTFILRVWNELFLPWLFG